MEPVSGPRNGNFVRMIVNGGVPVDYHGKGRNNPLYVACRAGYEQIVWILLEKGTDVNALYQWGTVLCKWHWTPDAAISCIYCDKMERMTGICVTGLWYELRLASCMSGLLAS